MLASDLEFLIAKEAKKQEGTGISDQCKFGV